MGRLRRTRPRRLYWQAARWQHSPSHRSAHSFADAHHILAAGAASASRRLKRLAAHQAAAARSRILLSSRHAGRRRFELFLLRRHPAHQRGHRHHRAIHRARLGSALRSRPPPAKAHAPKNCRRRLGRNRNRSRHQPVGQHVPELRSISILTASSPRCWPHSPSPSTTSADTAFSPATIAGASSSGPSPPHRSSGSSSILPGKSLPPITSPRNGFFFSCSP